MSGFWVEVARFLLIAVWAQATMHKARRFADHQVATARLTGLNGRAARLVALLSVVAEAWLVAVLAFGDPRLGFAGSLVLLAAYTAVLVHALRGGRAVPCNCLARETSPVDGQDVTRNGVLLLLALGGLGLASAGGHSTPEIGVLVVAAATGLVLSYPVARFKQFVTFVSVPPA